MNGRASILAISTFLLLILPTHFVGCGGGGGGGGDGDDGVVIPGDFLLFYGDNTNPDTGGDGLFKIQDGDLRLLKIINPVGKSHVQGFTAFGELTIFSACNVGADCEPWITDGTSEGTRLLKDINPYGDSNPLGYILFDDEIYFSADDGEYGVELWKTNGTENGTVIVKNIGIEEDLVSPTPISSDPHALTIFNGALYFVANDIDYEGYGQGIELWKTDSTETGTVIVKNIAVEDPDNPSGDPDTPIDSSPHALTVFNGALYFAATDGPYGPDQYGIELWKTDGTEVNTVIVKNIGVDAGLSYDSSPEQFTIFNNELYFFADDGSSGFEPWKTDGTEGGTVMVQNIGNEVAEPFPLTADNLTYWAEVGGNLFFTADSGTTGVEPWSTDGTDTLILEDINPSGNSVVPGQDDVFHVFGNQLFFFADDGTHGFEPWISISAVAGWQTALIKDIASVPINAPVTADGLKFLTDYRGRLYFTADDGTTGQEIWSTDGTEIDTNLLKNIGPDFEAGYADTFGPEILDGVLLFSAFDGGINVGHGIEMWQTMGTEAGTLLVEDLNPGALYDGVLKAIPLPLP